MAVTINGKTYRNLEDQVKYLTSLLESIKSQIDGKQNELTPGEGIDITDDVISCTVQPGGTYTAGDGISISDNEVSVKVGEGLFFDSDDQVCLNNATQTAIASIAGKSVVSGTHDGINWTRININGTEKNIPAGGGTTKYLHQVTIQIVSDNGSGQNNYWFASINFVNSSNTAYTSVGPMLPDIYQIFQDNYIPASGGMYESDGYFEHHLYSIYIENENPNSWSIGFEFIDNNEFFMGSSDGNYMSSTCSDNVTQL